MQNYHPDTINLDDYFLLDKDTPVNEIDFVRGQTILIDKPLDWTSFDVVNKIRGKIRYQLGFKKIKVGHAGTLDPLATGLLIICTGKLTKSIDLLQAIEKRYSGTITLGATTATYDAEVEPENIRPTDHLTEKDLQDATTGFRGKIEQIPPIYSAIKIEGHAAYNLARRGKDPIMKARSVEITRFDLTKIQSPHVEFDVICSKGTYIRSLANDFGQVLGVGGYLSGLRREAIGQFSVQKAFTIEEIINLIESITPIVHPK